VNVLYWIAALLFGLVVYIGLGYAIGALV